MVCLTNALRLSLRGELWAGLEEPVNMLNICRWWQKLLKDDVESRRLGCLCNTHMLEGSRCFRVSPHKNKAVLSPYPTQFEYALISGNPPPQFYLIG